MTRADQLLRCLSVLGATTLGASGCPSTPPFTNPGASDTDDGSTGASVGSEDGADGESDGGDDGHTDPPPGGDSAGCDVDLSPSADDCVLEAGDGVFVATWGDDAGAGTTADPVASIGRAVQLASAGAGRIYACAGDYAVASVAITSPLAIYGGLSCDGVWSYTGDTTHVHGPGTPLVVATVGDVRLEDLSVESDAADPDSGTSIALLARDARLAIVRGVFAAADGLHGAGAVAMARAPDGVDGEPGRNEECVEVSTVMYGAGAVTPRCPGGAGGDGGPGSTFGMPGEPAAVGGDAGTFNTFSTSCSDGGPGTPGSDGTAGVPGSGPGTLGPNGWRADLATAGDAAQAGAGGGGGAGALPPGLNCTVSDTELQFAILPGGGGGGGSGGCGGDGGLPGDPGGSSIAIASVNAELTLQDSALRTGGGGNGGDGAAGQAGGFGGAGGPGGAGNGSGCASSGGTGGDGGRGGAGAGGSGGHAVAIASIGPVPVVGPGTVLEYGAAGVGGASGNAASQGAGPDGIAAERLEF